MQNYTIQWRARSCPWQELEVKGTDSAVCGVMNALEAVGNDVTCALVCEPFPAYQPLVEVIDIRD